MGDEGGAGAATGAIIVARARGRRALQSAAITIGGALAARGERSSACCSGLELSDVARGC